MDTTTDKFIGLTLDEIHKAYSCQVRIMKRDGESFLGTQDRKINRLNVHLKENKVIYAYWG